MTASNFSATTLSLRIFAAGNVSTAMYADDLKAEFDTLYAEAGMRRRRNALVFPQVGICSTIDHLREVGPFRQ